MPGRAVSERIERIIGEEFRVLDKGFIRVIDYMGNDDSIAEAARVSYGEGTKKTRDNRGLIRYLMRHDHSSPFEMCELKLHVKMPIFVARQWVRHRTANVNEVSARYSVLDDEFYIPGCSSVAKQSSVNNQGRGEMMDDGRRQSAIADMETNSLASHRRYSRFLEDGMARELARIVLPVNTYTEWYWKSDLSNILKFLKLRSDSHAQHEIREYADTLMDIVKDWVPIAHEAFMDYHANAEKLSAMESKALKEWLETGNFTVPDGMSKREADEFAAKWRKKA